MISFRWLGRHDVDHVNRLRRRLWAAAFTMLVAVGSTAILRTTLDAQAPQMSILLRVGVWIADQLAGYLIGKAIDRAVGLTYQSELRQTSVVFTAQ